MALRRYSLVEPYFDIQSTVLAHFSWDVLSYQIRDQIGYQQQFLGFFKHFFLQSLASVPEPNPKRMRPWVVGLGLRAAGLKMYVLSTVSILEGALAELAAQRGLGARDALLRLPFGALMDRVNDNPVVKVEFEEVWTNFEFLRGYRNFIHLGNAAQNAGSYWKHILDKELAILTTCDTTIEWMSKKCCKPNGTVAAETCAISAGVEEVVGATDCVRPMDMNDLLELP